MGNLWKFPNWKSWNFPNCKYFEFSKLPIFAMVQIGILSNIYNFLNSETQNFTQKIGNFVIVRPFDILYYSQFCQSSYLPFDINQFFPFLFSRSLTRNFGGSKFERSSISKFEGSYSKILLFEILTLIQVNHFLIHFYSRHSDFRNLNNRNFNSTEN